MKPLLLACLGLLIISSCKKETAAAKKVTSITVNPSSPSILAGGTLSLAVTVLPADAEPQTVKWTSASPTIASVDAVAGVVTGAGVGTAIITAAATDGSGVIGVATVTVKPIKVTSIAITPPSSGVTVGGTQQLTTAVTPANATYKEVAWSSSNPEIAAVSVTGLALGLKPGSVIITATAKDEDRAAGVAIITVTAAGTTKATSITISPSAPSVRAGETLTLAAAVLPAEASQGVTWTSSVPAIARIDASTGAVTGAAAGNAVITATAADGSGVTGTAVVTGTTTAAGTTKATSITISPSAPSVRAGETLTLAAAVLPAEASQGVTWTSSAPAIARIDASAGIVSGVAPGTAAITATAADGSGITGTATVTVTAVARATSITISPSAPSVRIGETLTLAAAALPAEASQGVTWTSSAPAIARIDPSAGIVTGVAPGTAAITATAADGSGITGAATVTVKSNDASVSAITLGDENFPATVPAAGQTATLAHAPHTISSGSGSLAGFTAVKVNITAAAGAAIKIETADFTQGQTVNFTNPVTFTVTAQDGTMKSYTIHIPAYNAATNPYGIYTAKHLADVANARYHDCFLLKNDITLPYKNAPDAAAITGIPDYASKGWLPIYFRRNDEGFDGTFDGGGFSINNLCLNRYASKAGLFEKLGFAGIIKNLGVNGVTTGTAVSGESGNEQHTGILVGYSRGNIYNCYATGNVSSSSPTDSYAGGLAGHNGGCIEKSYASGNASSSGSGNHASLYAGGLTGYNEGNIKNCYAAGNVTIAATPSTSYTGGLTGGSNGSIWDCYATGNVTVLSTSDYSLAGGFSGGRSERGHVNCYRHSNATITKNGVNISASPDDASFAGVAAKTKAYMQTDAFKGNLNRTPNTWGRSDKK